MAYHIRGVSSKYHDLFGAQQYQKILVSDTGALEGRGGEFIMNVLEQQIKDYVRGGLSLFWQRQLMFLGATVIVGIFLDLKIALICYFLCLVAEFIDLHVSKQVLRWDGQDVQQAERFLRLLTLSSILSASTVSLYVVLVSRQEGQIVHFAPLFFLFSAALFAAMNNHQLPGVLFVRLVIYGSAFIYIPARDLVIARPAIGSDLWMQFATVLFVLYFIVDCSRIFLKFYRNGLVQIDNLRSERDRAEAAYKMQSQFVSVVSHELRTPLTSIKGALGLLVNGALGKLPEKAQNITEIAHKNSNRLALLIDDLLDLQKLEAGKMVFRMDGVDLAELVKEAAASVECMARTMNVTIRCQGTDQPIFVKGDHHRLTQVIVNVLANAIKFSNKGGVVDIRLEMTNSKARVLITDYGIGIPDDARERVFGKFMQVDSSDQRKTGGTGLGLNISRQIIEAHGGSIDYVSKLGEGTTFFIELDLYSDND